MLPYALKEKKTRRLVTCTYASAFADRYSEELATGQYMANRTWARTTRWEDDADVLERKLAMMFFASRSVLRTNSLEVK